MIPDILEEIAASQDEDTLVLCPGICYRRDVVDMKHVGEPHQLEIWRIKKGAPRLTRDNLIELIELVIECTAPGTEYRILDAIHPYTVNGLEIEVMTPSGWLEVLECGEAHPQLLKNAGLDPEEYSGLALGLGLDRLVMVIKGIDDIRLLRADDPRIATQMLDLEPYRAVSSMPPVRQDMSVSVAEGTMEEDVCEQIIDEMGTDADVLEEITILSETPYDVLPPQAVERLGIKPGQKNLLVRVILRSHERSLTHEEANAIRDRIYRAIDQSETGGYVGK